MESGYIFSQGSRDEGPPLLMREPVSDSPHSDSL